MAILNSVDVADQAKVGSVKHGTMIVGVNAFGDASTVTSNQTPNPAPVTAIETKLTNRFDDPRYYAGDTPA